MTGAAMDHFALATAVFLGGLAYGFSGFAFSATAVAILRHFLPRARRRPQIRRRCSRPAPRLRLPDDPVRHPRVSWIAEQRGRSQAAAHHHRALATA
jgi:hypothetical protein